MKLSIVLIAVAAVLAACSSGGPSTSTATATVDAPPGAHTFTADVWADNWFEMYVNGATVKTDSVPITTERSFNKESFTFAASYPLTVAIQGKDYMKDESGLEYIGTPQQQMGDAGLIAQIKDSSNGKVIVATTGSWKTFVVQQAPLNIECEKSANPDADCKSKRVGEPAEWKLAGFDDASWPAATVYTADQVGPKDGYNDVSWDSAAKLIWADDLKTDNIVLFRTSVTG